MNNYRIKEALPKIIFSGDLKNIIKTITFLGDINTPIDVTSYKLKHTPLTLAILMGKYDVAKFLLDNNADPNVYSYTTYTNVPTYTTLHYLAKLQPHRLDLVKLLLYYGADASLLTYDDQHTIDIVQKSHINRKIVISNFTDVLLKYATTN
jgi:ankyrin repeat protein